jgi:hypothetical protein
VDLHEEERLSSDFEEVVVEADAVEVEDLAPDPATRRSIGVMSVSLRVGRP